MRAGDGSPRGGRQWGDDPTAERLLDFAREQFARHGFAAAPVDGIVREHGPAQGAAYRFESKRALFEAVYEREEVRLCKQVAAAGEPYDNPLEAARARWRAFLDAAVEPGLQRIVLIDAPSVLGWEKSREIATRHGLALIRRGLKEVLPGGDAERRDLEVLALMLHGSLTESALVIACSSDRRAARQAIEAELENLLLSFAGGNSS